jgi:hypothetical protein
MEAKDILTIVLSTGAICVSIGSFIFSFRQRSTEDRYTNRKALTDVIAELSKVNIAFAQLEIDHPGSADARIVNVRRNYNVKDLAKSAAQRIAQKNMREDMLKQIQAMFPDL